MLVGEQGEELYTQRIENLKRWIDGERKGEEIDLDREVLYPSADYSVDDLEELLAHHLVYIQAKERLAA